MLFFNSENRLLLSPKKNRHEQVLSNFQSNPMLQLFPMQPDRSAVFSQLSQDAVFNHNYHNYLHSQEDAVFFVNRCLEPFVDANTTTTTRPKEKGLHHLNSPRDQKPKGELKNLSFFVRRTRLQKEKQQTRKSLSRKKKFFNLRAFSKIITFLSPCFFENNSNSTRSCGSSFTSSGVFALHVASSERGPERGPENETAATATASDVTIFRLNIFLDIIELICDIRFFYYS